MAFEGVVGSLLCLNSCSSCLLRKTHCVWHSSHMKRSSALFPLLSLFAFKYCVPPYNKSLSSLNKKPQMKSVFHRQFYCIKNMFWLPQHIYFHIIIPSFSVWKEWKDAKKDKELRGYEATLFTVPFEKWTEQL